MVYGQNLTDPGMDSNGSGKSGLIEGITLAITGKTCRDVSREEFVNIDEDFTFVELSLENKITKVNNLVIKRWIDKKKSARIEIWENNELNKEITSVNEANSRIFELIGISREDLLHFFIIGQGTNYSFLSSGDSEQKNIISRLTNLDILNEKIEQIKFIIKEYSNQKEGVEKNVQKYENFINLVDEEISDEKINSKNRFLEKIKSIEDEILNVKNEIKDLENSKNTILLQINEEKESLKKLIKGRKDSKSLEEEIDENRNQIRSLKNKSNEIRDLSQDLKRHLDGKISCPNCKFQWSDKTHIKIEEIPSLLNDLGDKYKSLEKKIKLKTNKRESLALEYEMLEKEQYKISTLKKRISNMEFDENRVLNKIKLKHDEIEESKKSISKLKEQMNSNDKIVQLKEKRKNYQNSLNKYNQDLLNLEVLIAKYDFWNYHFSKKGFLTYLVNQSIKMIEGVTNSYLKKFNTDLQVNIDGYTVLKNGEIREKININILRKGLNVGNYERYSGGEKGRINLACILGLQKLMNTSSNTGGLNFLGLDEVFEGLDGTGQKEVLNILESTNITTMVVSHMNNSIGAENELMIKKINGISKIYENKK
jgi:DNA repair exonuclease SbcCD ATPase subunit